MEQKKSNGELSALGGTVAVMVLDKKIDRFGPGLIFSSVSKTI